MGIEIGTPHLLDLSLMNALDEFRILIDYVDQNCFTANNPQHKFDSWEDFKQILFKNYYSS
ncbi:MAG: hypothetical protein E4G98_04465 [Promethearchaeota archaeon]|nr:MAG: hypothetical protein E4G98_04465 [Candidatus Lokiarchaeota archaeon]